MGDNESNSMVKHYYCDCTTFGFFIVQVYGAEAFNISAFAINMTVHEDNSYLVVETINVVFTNRGMELSAVCR